MTDEFSINDVNRKRSRKQGDGIDDLRNIDPGEAAWDLDEKDKISTKVEKNTAADEIPLFPPMPGFGDEEEPAKPSSLDLMRLLRGVWPRRNMVIIVTVVTTFLFTGLALTLLHHKWTANVVLIKRESLDQFQIGSGGTPYKQQNYSLKTMLDTLKLPSVLIETIAKSGIQASPRILSSAIGLNIGKESNIFTVTVTWDDARVAANIANNLVAAFIESNVSMRRSDAMEVYEYYGAQLANAEASFKKFYDALVEFQEEYGVINFDSQTEVLLSKVADLDIEYRTLRAELEVDHQALQRLLNTLKDTPEMVVGASIYRNPLKNKLNDLEWQLEQARGRYTDKNPKVTDLLEQVESLQKMIEEGKDETTPEQTMSINTVKQDLELRKIELEDAIKLKQARVDSVKFSLDSINEKLSTMTAKQKEYFQLKAEKDAVSGVIDNLRNRVEEARVIMLSGKGDFELVEPATPPEEPQSSGRKLMVIAGFVLGGGGGLFIALLLEFFSPLVRTRKEVIGITQLNSVFEVQHVPQLEQDIIEFSQPDENIAKVFRRLVNDLMTSVKSESLQSVAFVSADRSSGRSMVLTNMAQAFSLKEQRCLLVDADVAQGAGTSLADYYEVADTDAGLMAVLGQNHKLSGNIITTDTPKILLMPTAVHLSSGGFAEQLLGSRRMAGLIEALRKFQGYVFYDLPPLVKFETAYEAAAEIGYAILVVRSGICHKREIQAVVERLKASNVEILAAIVTDVPAQLMSGRLQFPEVKIKRTK